MTAVRFNGVGISIQFLASNDAGIFFNSNFHFRYRSLYCHNADELNQIFYTRSYGRNFSTNIESRMHLSQMSCKISKSISVQNTKRGGGQYSFRLSYLPVRLITNEI